jgi:hypothetical protein
MTKTIGFIRVRKRKTKDSHDVASFDIVRAVRLRGQPRHKFVLGLGTVRHRSGDIRFWMNALERMAKHGLSQSQRKHFIQAITRKGVQLPTRKDCRDYQRWSKNAYLWNQEKEKKLRNLTHAL